MRPYWKNPLKAWISASYPRGLNSNEVQCNFLWILKAAVFLFLKVNLPVSIMGQDLKTIITRLHPLWWDPIERILWRPGISASYQRAKTSEQFACKPLHQSQYLKAIISAQLDQKPFHEHQPAELNPKNHIKSYGSVSAGRKKWPFNVLFF